MMKKQIKELIAKYFEGETTLSEEQMLKTYFAGEIDPQFEDVAPIFRFWNRASSGDLDIDIAGIIEHEREKEFAQNKSELVNKYWAAETTVEEENELYLASRDADFRHQNPDLAILMDYFQEQRKSTSKTDVRAVLDKAKKPPKIVPLKRWMTSVAAVLVLGLAVYSMMNGDRQIKDNNNNRIVMLDSPEDTRDALIVTKQALALLSSKMNKETNRIKKSVSKAKAVRIFK